jgi:hypothetical protein
LDGPVNGPVFKPVQPLGGFIKAIVQTALTTVLFQVFLFQVFIIGVFLTPIEKRVVKQPTHPHSYRYRLTLTTG